MYSILSLLRSAIPKNLIQSHEAFRVMIQKGFIVKRKGKFNLVNNFDENGFKIILKRKSSDPLVFNEIFADRQYNQVLSIIKENKIHCSRLMDAGANIGCFTIFMKSLFPDVEILAIEPNSDTFNRMVKNVKLNELKGIDMLNAGLWSSNTFLDPDRSFRDGEDWSFALKESGQNAENGIQSFTVQHLLEKQGWKDVAILKIDIEGAERELFRNQGTVKPWLNKIGLLVIEIHDELNIREDIYKILEEFDFQLTEGQNGILYAINKSKSKSV